MNLNFDECIPEVVGDVISGAVIEWVGMDVRVEFGASRLNSDRIIRLVAGLTRFYAHTCSVYLHFTALQQKQLVVSYPAGL